MADVDGGDENDEEEDEGGEADGDDDSDVVVGRGGVAIGEVHLIGPGFLRRCCAHVQAVLLAVLEMSKFLLVQCPQSSSCSLFLLLTCVCKRKEHPCKIFLWSCVQRDKLRAGLGPRPDQ